MNRSYVVVEGRSDEELLRQLLPESIISNVQFVVGEGRRSAESKARSIAAVKNSPVALVIDADTIDEEVAEERKRQSQEMLISSGGPSRCEVFVFVPEIEIVFFKSEGYMREVLNEEMLESRVLREGMELIKHGQWPFLTGPKRLLVHIHQQSSEDKTSHLRWTESAKNIAPEFAEEIRQQTPIRELIQFLGTRELSRLTIIGPPASFLETFRDRVNKHIRENKMYHVGIISAISSGGGGAGLGPHPTDTLMVHLRDGVAFEDAKAIISLALDRFAEENDLVEERGRATLMFEGEDGRDREM